MPLLSQVHAMREKRAPYFMQYQNAELVNCMRKPFDNSMVYGYRHAAQRVKIEEREWDCKFVGNNGIANILGSYSIQDGCCGRGSELPEYLRL